MADDIEFKVLQLLDRASNNSGIPKTITRDQHLSDLGIDSMKMVEITFELEKFFGIEMKEAALSQLVTVTDLIKMVSAAAPA